MSTSMLTYIFSPISVVTITSGLISYPIDTIRRRMMMTSGQAVKYSGSIDCTKQILKNEGFMAMMNGAGKFCHMAVLFGAIIFRCSLRIRNSLSR